MTLVMFCYTPLVKTYEYRLRPNKQQRQLLMACLIASRHLYNQGLQECIEHYEATGKSLHIYEQDKRHGKAAHPDLPAVVVDTTLKRLHRSFSNFFQGKERGIGYPRFKGRHRWHSIQLRDSQHALHGASFHAPRQMGGKLRTVVHRQPQGTFKFARLVLRPSGWYLQCVHETVPQPLPVTDTGVGLDMGVTYLVADSEGRQIANPKHLIAAAEKLAQAQRRMAKCQKGSHRRKKAVWLVARQHERIANRRKDTLHKIARAYVNRYQVIAIEDLQPANMVKNHSLARAILDSSWGMLRWMLTYKAAEAGRQVIAVPPHYTSQDCSACGARVTKSLSVRTHICPTCGYVADRDVNAALNIWKAAQVAQSLDEGFAEGWGGA